jgi:hypothetical protein
MKARDLTEASPLTAHGSISPDLLVGKGWLCAVLKELGFDQFDSIYILGSWYGNMSYILNICGIKANQIINVDINQDYLNFSKKLLSQFDNIVSMHQDANKLDYRRLGKQGLVINTSTSEMKDNTWLENIPQGTLVALQGRKTLRTRLTLKEFDRNYPLSKTLYLDQLSLKDPEVEYERFMKIGIK